MYSRRFLNTYFWRSYSKKEIDYIESSGGNIFAYEFKYSAKTKVKIPKEFLNAYPEAKFKTITPENYFEFIWQ